MRIRIHSDPEHPHLEPLIRLKEGIHRRDHILRQEETSATDEVRLGNDFAGLTGGWQTDSSGGWELSLSLQNRSQRSIRLARLFLPLSAGLAEFLQGRRLEQIGFLSNGYQSWSQSRSYRLNERPFRSWLRMVSIISGNMANLPSNKTGDFSGELFALLTDTGTDESILIGQLSPLDQFLYIRCVVAGLTSESNHFELIWDFGRQSIEPGATIDLSGIRIRQGPSGGLLEDYFDDLGRSSGAKATSRPLTGWSSWYFYYNRLTPPALRANLSALREAELPIDYFQIDDGYQRLVGDWIDPAPGFEDMRGLSDEIRAAGIAPGIWLAPFIADRKSRLAVEHPEYLLRSEHGKALPAGYNLNWPGRIYYALDITNPRVEEFVRSTISRIVREWGFEYLKLDFLYAACLRGGAHKDIGRTRAQIMRRGVEIIREEAGPEVILSGCGMPLSAGIGSFETMRVGADTAPSWHRFIGRVLRSGSVEGVKNSIRNSLVRAPMNQRLWQNDPDCVLLRSQGTRLNREERRTQINAAVLAGGTLFFSDDFSNLGAAEIDEARQVTELHRQCATGETIVLDLMEQEFPELVFNSAGFLGIFNMHNRKISRSLDLSRLPSSFRPAAGWRDVWSGKIITPEKGCLRIDSLLPHSSLLLQAEW